MSKWQDAHVGVSDERMTLRVTEEEKERLEELRRQQGLTSKAQVIRRALDLMEILATPGTFMLEGPKGVKQAWEEHPEFVEGVLKRLGLNASKGGEPATDAGLPGAAPAADQEGKQ